MSKSSCVLTFWVGVAVGSVVSSVATWKLVKDKYEKLAQEEIDSVKEVFSKRVVESDSTDESDKDIPEEENHEESADSESTQERNDDDHVDGIMKKYNYEYTPYSDSEKARENEFAEAWDRALEEKVNEKSPCVIPPDEFGENMDYERLSFTYYADGVVADDNDEFLENVDEVIGVESLDHFGEWEDEAVYVRNDKFKCYYEILLDNRTYEEVLEEKPYLRS